MRTLRQVIRGCGTMPHVGNHPGTVWFAALVAVGALQGVNNGWIGAAIGGCLMFAAMGAIYFTGAYQRAGLSDRLEAKRTT